MRREDRDILISVLLCAIAVTVFFLSNTIRTMIMVEQSPIINSRFYPKFLSVLLFICGSLIGIRASLTRLTRKASLLKETSVGQPSPDGTPQIDENAGQMNARGLALTALACVLYLILFEALGFLFSTVLFMASLLKLLGSKSWHGVVFPAIVTPVAVYTLFRFMLGVPLPRGILPF